jgi:hypothetical protein
MSRKDDFIRVCTSRNLWYNFDTKEILTDEQLRLRNMNPNNISSRPNEIPVFGNIQRALRIWIPFMEQQIQNNQPFGQIRVREAKRRQAGKGYPSVRGFVNIPAFSKGAKPYKQLSPFFVTVDYEENGEQRVGEIFENFFQSRKVYRQVTRQTGDWVWPAETHVDANDNPNENWIRWNRALSSHELPIRHPNGKAIPLYAWWKGQKLGVVEMRKQIYIPFLQAIYRQHPVYQQILAMVRRGTNIIILGPDGPNMDLYPNGMPVTLEMLVDLQNVTRIGDIPHVEGYVNNDVPPGKYFPYGHEFVIALTLLEDLLQ